MIAGLFTELTTAGGVQCASRLTAAVLAQFAAERGSEFLFLSLNDPRTAKPFTVGVREIPFVGFDRSKTKFSAASLRVAAAHQPTLIIALHPHLAPITAAMKRLIPRARTVVFTHGVEVWAPLGGVRGWGLRQSDLALAPSADTLSRLIQQQGLPDAKVKKLRWSLGPEFDSNPFSNAAQQPPEGFPPGRVILTVGRWDAREAYKGVDTLITAMPGLLADTSDLRLVAIGDGTDLPRLENLARQQGVSDRVHFLPRVPPPQIAAAYDACELFALPSRGEGFGLVFLEAMSHRKPVIGGAHGGTPEIIEDGVDGFLVEHGNVAQLTDRIRRLLTNDTLRREMAEKAFERVRSDFSYFRFSDELKGLLKALLER